MLSPHDPQAKEQGEVLQDGMSQSGSAEQANRAGNTNSKEEKEEK